MGRERIGHVVVAAGWPVFQKAIMILSLGGIHVLAIFSQILSNGRNLLGAVSLVMLYAGAILLVIVDHLLR